MFHIRPSDLIQLTAEVCALLLIFPYFLQTPAPGNHFFTLCFMNLIFKKKILRISDTDT